MATRRGAVSRTGSTAPASSSTRPRSVATNSRPASSIAQRSTQPTPTVDDGPPPALKRLNIGSKDGAETNIRVAVRIRKRSDKEVEENSPIIINSEGAKSTQLVVEGTQTTSTMPFVDLPPTTTYPFDLVFGPEADQSLIYQEVVAPMLEEVLQGYNCTLFAYGQTGSGKTYTMQGDLGRTPLGNPSVHAGMIPRVLFRLFHHLETNVPDYSVKVSYLEIYNEELRDLLGHELAAPVGTQQPMGKDSQKTEGLKIFDDSGKKGVFVQGLEEVGVRSSEEALAVLNKGSQRRQMAATKMNEHSSRSHAVFTLTVHTKETSTAGEDLLRVGKMNLVDLAGSESIGRSGAVDTRAREAGMINQSLLTLGRVISALEERTSHIPYRESKLTRLLQDSLGGRTKTCIIATVSPARSNMEETNSTLNYALKAKSIRNRPQVNQRMTRNSLLKEYVSEIERLKADVQAAREKNGLFISEERWKEHEEEQELARTEALEAKNQVGIIESRLRNMQEEFDQSIAVLKIKDSELKDVREKIAETEQVLEQTKGELQETEDALRDETVVRKAHEETEAALHEVATGLREVATQGLSDLDGVFSKLDRKDAVLTSNTKTVQDGGKSLARHVQTLTSQLDNFASTSNQHAQKLRSDTEHLQKTELAALSALNEHVNEQAERTQKSLGVIRTNEEVADEAMRSIESVVSSAFDNIKKGFNAWAETLQKSSKAICNDLQQSSQDGFASVEKAVKSVTTSLDSVVHDAQTYVEAERRLASDARTAAEAAVAAELAHLRAQNDRLAHLLEAERSKSERARDTLTEKIAALIGDYAAERESSVRDGLTEVEEANVAAEAALGKFRTSHGEYMDDALSKGKQFGSILDKKSVDLKRTRDGAFKTLTASNTSLRSGLANLQSHITESITVHATDADSKATSLKSSFTTAHGRLSNAKRARLDVTQRLATDSQAGYKTLQQNVASSSKLVEASTSKITLELSDWHTATTSYTTTTKKSLGAMHQSTRTLLSEGAKPDVPTGMTPQKRQWAYNDKWERTKDREVLLGEAKRQPQPHSRSSLRGQLFTDPQSSADDDVPTPSDTPLESPVLESSVEDEEPIETIVEENAVVEKAVEVLSVRETEPIPPPPPYQQIEMRPSHSRTSSLTQAMPPPPARMAPAKRAFTGLPKSAPQPPLSERPANVMANRRRLK